MKRENPDFPPFVGCFLQLYPTIRMASGRNQPLGAVIIRAIKRRSVYTWFNTDMWFLAGAFRWFPQRCRPNYSLDRNLFELFHLFGFSRPPGLELGSGVDTVQFISAGKKNVQLNFHSNLNRNFDHFLSLSLSWIFFLLLLSFLLLSSFKVSEQVDEGGRLKKRAEATDVSNFHMLQCTTQQLVALKTSSSSSSSSSSSFISFFFFFFFCFSPSFSVFCWRVSISFVRFRSRPPVSDDLYFQ